MRHLPHVHPGRRRRMPRAWRQAPVAVLLLIVLLIPALSVGAAEGAPTLAPIGGGYSDESLAGFSQLVIDHSDGEMVKIVVVPSSYGDAPEDREENIELAGERTQQIEDACVEVLAGQDTDFAGCEAVLAILFDRADAENPANSVDLEDAETDGVYILGGDQTIAMQVLADTPAEDALEVLYNAGGVISGTSAGAAVESINMIWGYTDPGWPYNAYEKPNVLAWWDDGDMERGLRFGSKDVIFDQHFYERGRFARLLNIVAQSDEIFDGESKVGVGLDWGTGIVQTGNTMLSDVFGYTSTAFIDMETLDASIEWVGEKETLSARNVLTSIFAQHEDASYDIDSRTFTVGGEEVVLEDQPGWNSNLLRAPGEGTLILGGNMAVDWDNDGIDVFIDELKDNGSRRIAIVAAAGENSFQLRRLAAEYVRGLWFNGASPFSYTVEVYIVDGPRWSQAEAEDLEGVGGVIFVGDDQQHLGSAVENRKLTEMVEYALENVPVVMTDGALTAAMGEWFVSSPDPTDDDYEDVASEAFMTDGLTFERGWGIIEDASFEPSLGWDNRWGRLYALAMEDPENIVFGIHEMTALVLDGSDATVEGDRSVTALDARGATFAEGENGAFSAFNVILDAFAPGDTVETDR